MGMRYFATVRFIGRDVTPEWAKKKHEHQKAEWDSRVQARIMTGKYIGTSKKIADWVQWYHFGPVTSVRVSKSWSEQR